LVAVAVAQATPAQPQISAMAAVPVAQATIGTAAKLFYGALSFSVIQYTDEIFSKYRQFLTMSEKQG
jgi:hypothetical protein